MFIDFCSLSHFREGDRSVQSIAVACSSSLIQRNVSRVVNVSLQEIPHSMRASPRGRCGEPALSRYVVKGATWCGRTRRARQTSRPSRSRVISVEQLTNGGDVPVFRGLDQRHGTAFTKSTFRVRLGALLLLIAFVLQATSSAISL